MKKSKIPILLLIIAMILAISAVSAADMDDTSDSAIQSIGETAVDDVVSTGAVEDIQTATNDADVLAADGDGNFTELQTSVNTGMVMMNKDYTRVEGENDISISRDVTILGNNHKIDANNLGGIFNVNSGYTLTLIGVTLINGNAENGGAVYNNGGTLTITNSYFINNTATKSGGAIYNNGGTLNVIGSTFDGNDLTDRSTNGWGGAAIYDNAGTVLISTSTITNNLKDIVHRGGTGQYTGDLSSAAVTSKNGALTVSDSYFGKNSGSYGGAILSQGDDAVLSVVGSTFEDNFAFNGGAINIVSSKYTISNSTFRGNNAKGTGSSTSNYANGGAICAQENDNDDGLISDCIFEDNTAAIGGAITTQIAQVTGCTFTNNTALSSNSESFNGKTNDKGGFGGAVYNDNTITIEDSTFTDNIGRGRGLDLKNADISGSSFTNTIINVNNKGTVSVSDNLYDNAGKDISSTTGCTVVVTVGNGEIPLVTFGTIIFDGDLTFQDLQDIVDAGNTAITLTGNVLKSDEEEQTFANGILINHSFAIYAQDHTITANNGKVFTVNEGATLSLYKANVVGDGTTAIVNNGQVSLSLTNPSTFTNVGEFAIDNQGTVSQTSLTTFTQLSDLIALVNGGEIYIGQSKITKADDEKAAFADGIVIEKDLTIRGYFNSYYKYIDTKIDADNDGRIFSVNDGATLTLQKIILTNGNDEKGGAVYVEANNNFYADTVNFINNTATYRGGAIYSEGFVNVTNCVFDSNDITFRTANDDNGGAAIYNHNGVLNIADSKITNNLKDIVIRDGNAGDLLVGVVVTSGETFITDSYFANNTGSWGGAISSLGYLNANEYTLTVRDSKFEGNNATFGGAIFVESSNLEIDGCTFENNKGVGVGSSGTSSTQGGAIVIFPDNASAQITDSTFIGNSANMGGAVSLPGVDSESIIENCTFKDNTANDGGALYFWTEGADVLVSDSEFVNNTAQYGGAIENEGDGDLAVDNCIFTENTATVRGGAIISSGSTEVSNSVFTDNEAPGNTNAIYLWYPDTTLELSNNTITGSDDAQIYVKDGINITTPLKVRILDNDTYILDMSPYTITAVVTDEDDNLIFDYAFRFVVGDTVVEDINIDTNTGIYSALFTPTDAGTFLVSTNLEDESDVETSVFKVYRTLSELATLIQNTEENGTLVISNDYVYVPEFDSALVNGIVIDKDISIDGNGFTISGSNVARLFNVADNAAFDLFNVTLRDAKADKGAAVYVDDEAVFITHYVNFINNTAVYKGGAIYSEGVTAVISSVFDGNDITFRTANDDNGGAAIYNYNGGLQIIASNITNNLKDIVIREGNAGDLLVGVVVTSGDTVIADSYFANNTGSWGGAISSLGYLNTEAYTLSIRNSKFEGNNATFGGAIFVESSNLEVDNSTFENNKGVGVGSSGTSNTQGGAIVVFPEGASAQITDSTFIGNSANMGGAVSLAGVDSDSLIKNCTFTDNTANDGGAVYLWTGGDAVVAVEDSTFSGNTAGWGNAISTDGTLKLSNNTISSTSADIGNWGGYIVSTVKVVILNNETVDANTETLITATVTDDNDNLIMDINFDFVVGETIVHAQFNPATGLYEGIYTNDGAVGVYIVNITYTDEDSLVVKTATLRNIKGTFTDLQNMIDDDESGSISLSSDFQYVESIDGDKFVDGIIIDDNIIIDGNGSVISGSNVARIFNVVANTQFNLINVTLRDAKADKGAAVYVENNALFNAFDVDFINNTAVYRGGAIYSEGDVNVVGCAFDSNDITFRSANDDNGGAAIYNYNGGLGISGSNFTNNLKDIVIREGNAGDLLVGVVVTSGNTLISDSYFANNTGSWGGAISSLGYLNDEEYTLTVTDSRFEGNNATFGGAIFVESSNLEVDNSTFENNKGVGVGSSGTSNTQGGAIVVFPDGASAQITDSTFIGNSANMGGAVSLAGVDSDSLIKNCTFTDNTANDGGAVYLWTGGDAVVAVEDSTFSGNTAGWGNAISTDGTLKLSNNTISTTSADIGNWNGAIISTLYIEIMDNGTYSYHMSGIVLNATITDDNGNLIRDINFNFLIGETDEVSATFNGDIYTAVYTPTAPGTYAVNITYEDMDNLVIKTATITISKSLIDLAEIISNADEGDTIVLDGDYAYIEEFDSSIINGIVVDKYLTVDGNGFTISGSNVARLFNVTDDGGFTLKNVTLRDAKADKGAAVYVGENAVFDAYNVNFINNTAVYKGGAIYSEGATEITDSVFDSNDITFRSANDDNGGAAIYNYNGGLGISGSNFTNNLKDIVIRNGNAGDLLVGVVVTSGQTLISDSYFANNTGSWGGAISSLGYLNTEEYLVIVQDSKFEGNNATFGGAIFVESSNLEVDNCTFENNKGVGVGSSGTSNTQGGAIVVFPDNASAQITDSTFIGNSANIGGAVSLPGVDSDSIIENCTFKDNTANDGGALYFWTEGADVLVFDSEFINNTAQYGGAIENEGDGDLAVDNCVFTENTATVRGGAIISSGSTIVSDSVFADNEAPGNTNAIYLWYPDTTLALSNNTIIGDNKVQIFVKSGIDIVNPLNATFLGNQTVPAGLGDIFTLNATLTDDNGNFIYDADFKFSVDGETIDDIFFDAETGLYTTDYAITTAGPKLVSTNYELPGLVKYTGILDVPKANVTEFTVTVPDTLEGDNATVWVTLIGVNETGLNDIVTVIINNKEYAVIVENGTGTIAIEDLAHGQYPVVAMFDNSNYESAINSTVFYVKGQSKLNIAEITTAEYGDVIEITINLTDSEGNPLSGVVVIDNLFKVLIYEDGIGTFVIDSQPDVGNYTFQAVYDGNDDYFGYLDVFNVTVITKVIDPNDVVVEIPNINEFGEAIPVTITSPVDGTYTVNINGTAVNVEVVNGTGSANITLDKAGIYNATVDIAQEGYSLETITTDYFEYLVTPDFHAVITGTYPNAEISITGPAGTYHVDIDGRNIVDIIREESGLPTVCTIEGIDAGNYTAFVSFDSHDEYYGGAIDVNFTVAKADSKVTIEPITNVTYGNPVVIVYHIDNETDFVTISINKVGNDISEEFIDSQGTITANLPAGTYIIRIHNGESENYNEAENQAEFTVAKAEALTITVEGDVGVMGSATVNVTVASDATGYIIVDNNGVKDVYELVNGSYAFEIYDLEAGEYTITVTYLGDDNYNKTQDTKVLNIPKSAATPNVVVVTPEIKGGQEAELNVTMDNNHATGFVKIYVDGEEAGFVELDADYANVTVVINDLANGTHTIGVKYLGNDNFNESDIVNVTVDVVKADSKVTIDPITNVTVGNDIVIYYKVENLTNVKVEFTNPNDEIDVDYELFEDRIVVHNLAAGDYEVKVYNMENEFYNTDAAVALFSVNKIDVSDKIIIEPETITYGENATVIVSGFPEAATGNVTLKVGNKKYTAKVEQGQAVVEISGLAAGIYEDLAVEYSGDDVYNATNAHCAIYVNKAKSEVFIYAIGDQPYPGNFVIGYNIENETDVNIIINGPNGEEIPYTTDVDGNIVLTDLVAGQYYITIENKENENFTKYEAEESFKVYKADPTFTSNVTEDAKVGDNVTISVKTPADATGNVSVIVDGEIVATDLPVVNGVATINVTGLAAGHHSYEVTYNGDDNYEIASDLNSFDVAKVTPEITIEDIAGTVGTTVPATVTIAGGDATGYILYNNVAYEVKDGKATIQVGFSEAGMQSITVTYLGDDKYDNASKTVQVTVVKGTANPVITDVTTPINVGDDATFVVSMDPDMANGNVTVFVDGVENQVVILDGEYANASVTIKGLTSGTHTIGVRYNGNDNYLESQVITETISVNKQTPAIVIVIEDVGDLQTMASPWVNITVAGGDATGNIRIEGREGEFALVNGVYAFQLTDLLPGNYNVTVKYLGDDKYESASDIAYYSVSKAQATPAITDVTTPINVGDDATFVVSMDPDMANGNVTVFVDGVENQVVILDGEYANASVTIKGLTSGTHVVAVQYNGNDNFEASEKVTATISVNKEAVPENAINITEPTNATGEVINVNLPEDATGNVSVIVNGQEIANVPVENGNATIPVGSLPAGSNVVEVKYSGDDKYDEISVTKVIVKEKIDTVITVARAITQPANDYHAGERGDPIVILLQDANGNPLANKTIQIAINGPIYNLTTDENGIVRAPIGLSDANVYTYAVSFKGDETYNAAPLASCKLTLTSKTTSISASAKTFKAKAKTKTVTATLKVSKNKYDGKTYLSAGKKITLKVNGKTYTAKANAKGVVKFNIKLTKKGKYTATIKFAGDKTYKGSSKSIKITIK